MNRAASVTGFITLKNMTADTASEIFENFGAEVFTEGETTEVSISDDRDFFREDWTSVFEKLGSHVVEGEICFYGMREEFSSEGHWHFIYDAKAGKWEEEFGHVIYLSSSRYIRLDNILKEKAKDLTENDPKAATEVTAIREAILAAEI